MGDFTAVQFGSMAQGEADFASTYQQLHSTLTTLESQLQSSLSQWTGAAQAAYHVEKAKWDQAASDMAAVVAQLGKAIGIANENYTSAERVNSQMWGA
jgi:WXG100 family type VII secretion target